MQATKMNPMELKRVNVVIDEESHQVLLDFQARHDLRSKDKALSELLKDYKKCLQARKG